MIDKILKNQRIRAIWQRVKPWVVALSILLVLRFTGVLAGISYYAQSALVKTGIMNVQPEAAEKPKPLNFDFSIYTTDGGTVPFLEFKGKTIFINLWATWCGPCRAEMPSIQALYDKVNKDSVAFVMLSLDNHDKVAKVNKYVSSQAYSFPVYIAGELPEQLNVTTIPTTFVISPSGNIIYKKVGLANYDTKKFLKFLNEANNQ